MATEETTSEAQQAADEMQAEKPKTFKEALSTFQERITDEDEAAMLLAEQEQKELEESKAKREENKALQNPKAKSLAEEDNIEDWMEAALPKDPNFKIPRGKTLHFLMFKPEWTDRPEKGIRTCVMWTLSDADEKLAAKRTRGEPGRYLIELSKQMVRAIDGQKVDWTKGPGSNIEVWWNEIGGKCRNMVSTIFSKNHNMTLEEQKDFFVNCYAVRTAISG